MGYMTNGLTFNTLRNGNIERLARTEKFKECRTWTRAEWLQALVGEVGELANYFKKIDRGDYTLAEKQVDVAKELADIQIYLDLLAYKCGVNLGEATMSKFNEVSVRVSSRVWIDAEDWHLKDADKVKP
jgi:NTP pyrophosphatase (non-canonical NTP hydrolase)